MTAVDIRRFTGEDALARAAAGYVLSHALDAVEARGRFMFALTGGSTPRPLYEHLAHDAHLRRSFPWARTTVVWGDERHVPPTDADSNFRMADETLLAHVPIAPDHVHRIPAELPDAAEAAAAYERTLAAALGTEDGAPAPIDLLLLGMGEDGHIASLFPGSPALNESAHLVVANWVAALETWRITMTAPVLLGARATAVLVTGARKAAVLRDVMEGPWSPSRWPAQLLRGAAGPVTWFVDDAAAAALTR